MDSVTSGMELAEVVGIDSNFELLSPAQEIFNEGAQIATKFEADIQTSVDKFYERSIPFAYKVKSEKPWKSKEFSKFDLADPTDSLMKFLRASFGEKSKQKTAAQQATVLAMVIEDGLTYEDVAGIWFRYLLKLGYAFNQLTKATRQALLKKAKECKNVQEFEAAVESAKRGILVEPKKVKVLTGTKSAIQTLDDFDEKTSKAGDKRPAAEKLADIAGSAMYADTDFGTDTMARQILGGFCRYMRRREPTLNSVSDVAILSEVILSAWEMDDEMDEESYDELNSIKKQRVAD